MILLLAGAALAACDTSDPVVQGDPVEARFTFASDMEGWQAVATDTLNPPIAWHVRHTSDHALVGDGSVELQLENLNDAGKIWMERAFDLEPGATYEATLEYAFGTADGGDVNLFTIIAGVHTEPPRTAEALTFREDTGHGGSPGPELVWLSKTYDESITVPADGTLHVAIGVWGTWETLRTYFVDDVTVRFVPSLD